MFRVRRRQRDPSKTNLATRKNTAWTASIYTTWALSQPPEHNIPSHFDDLDPSRYNEVLSRFVSETKRSDGYQYKSNTLYQLANGLNRRVKDLHKGQDLDLFNSSQFAPFRDVLDALLLTRKDANTVPLSPKDLMTFDKEELLWRNSLGHSNPLQSLTTCIYVALRTFIMKGNETMKHLTFQDFQYDHITDEDVVIIFQRDGVPVGSHFESTKNSRGFYQNMVKYLARCPEAVRQGEVPLFQHPLKNWDVMPGTEWFHIDKPLGCNFFAKLVKDAFVKAGVDGGCTLSAIRTFAEGLREGTKPAKGATKGNSRRGVEITRRVFTDESTTKAGMLLLRTDESTTKAGMLLHSVLGTPLLDALNNQLLDVEGLSPNNFSTLMAYPEDSKDSSLNIPSLYTSPIETPWDSKRDVTTMTNNLITRTQSTECGSAEKANFNTAEKVECKPDFNSLVVDALLGIKRELSDIKDMEAKRLKIEERKLALMELTRIDS